MASASIAAVYRPLLLSTVSTDIAAARGVPVRLVGLLFMLALAVSVGLSSLAIGAILSTALLIGPPAAALRLTKSVAGALAVACLIGVAATWLGVLLAYDSYYWGSPATRPCRSASSSSPSSSPPTWPPGYLPPGPRKRQRTATPAAGAADRSKIAA